MALVRQEHHDDVSQDLIGASIILSACGLRDLEILQPKIVLHAARKGIIIHQR